MENGVKSSQFMEKAKTFLAGYGRFWKKWDQVLGEENHTRVPEFLGGIFFNTLAIIVFILLAHPDVVGITLFAYLMIVYIVMMLIPLVALFARRFRDTGLNGLWVLALAFPILLWVILIILDGNDVVGWAGDAMLWPVFVWVLALVVGMLPRNFFRKLFKKELLTFTVYTQGDLENKTFFELKELAKRREVKVPKGMNKEGLIQILLDDQERR